MEAIQTHRWTRREYERMGETGILAPDARTELIDGAIIEMSPQSSYHAATVSLAQETLRHAFGDGYTVRVQLPLALGATSEPEPDLAVVPGTPRDYVEAHPAEAALVVEVADTSLDFDRSRKAAVYARAALADYWIINLRDHCVEVYRDPRGGLYGAKQTLASGEVLAPLARPETPIAVADLLP
ncbi:MAG: Uma2 family endonuclease [Bacteroidetes bacterium]|jgi:Uma2 family endonuclease|nr:Uma2 family endonuclease [Bacteroidota bacterium]